MLERIGLRESTTVATQQLKEALQTEMFKCKTLVSVRDINTMESVSR